MTKIMPIQGLRLSNSIKVPLKIKHILNEEYVYHDEIQLWTYEDYLNLKKDDKLDFIGLDKIDEFDLLAVYETQTHNMAEVFNIKILITALYFAKRLAESRHLETNSLYINSLSNHEFFSNHHLSGFFGDDYIISDRWYVKLGNKKVGRDDFDQFIVRAFSYDILDEYDRQSKFQPTVTEIQTNRIFMEKLSNVMNKINGEDECSMKLRAALKIYYDVLSEADIDSSIVSYAIILEALLLSENEDGNQSKKVACRSACLIADNQTKTRKEFISDTVYKLYIYRNQIVHEGKSFLQLDNEVTILTILKSIRHIIYLVVKYIIDNNIKEISEIKDIVIRNKINDNLDNAFAYVTVERNDPIAVIYMGE